jgi:hypothetical protein
MRAWMDGSVEFLFLFFGHSRMAVVESVYWNSFFLEVPVVVFR